MLVDLGRNDLGRVCDYGTRARAAVHDDRALLARHAPGLARRGPPAPTTRSRSTRWWPCFPAGTVSGAPKIRAMEIIAELEPSRRGVYAGAVGYLDFAGNLDCCIAIRTLVHARRRAPRCRPAPASSPTRDPAAEYEETPQQGARAAARARARARGSCGDGPADRQLRFVHLQPRAVSRRARRRGRRCAATTQITLDEIAALAPSRIVISPGPGRPEDAGHLDRRRSGGSAPSVPILGVCLGHQAMGDGVRRQRRARAAADARQDARRSSTTARASSPACRAVRGRALSLAGRVRRTRWPAVLEVTARTGRRRHDDGAAAPRVADARRAVPSRSRS